MDKVFIARSRSALKARAQYQGLDLNDYVIFNLNDKARKNETLKSVVPNITEDEYKFLMVHKSFVVITTDGGLRVSTSMIGENEYANELNTPEEEAPGDKFVSEGVVKSVLDKLPNLKGLSDSEKETITAALKSWGEHKAEELSGKSGDLGKKGESKFEFVEELDKNDPAKKESGAAEGSHATTKTVESDEGEEDEKEDEDEDEEKEKGETKSLASLQERLNQLTGASAREELLANLKSLGSISEEEPIFQSKHAAHRFAQTYNNSASDSRRAEVAPANRHIRKMHGTRARFVVEFNK